MEKQFLKIDGIPAILWGRPSDTLFIAVHGDRSNKADTVIAILAEEAAKKGCQTLSFDLPGHGDHKSEPRLCNAQNCVFDLDKVMLYAHGISSRISLFGCSMGAYFSMLAYAGMPLHQALFLSPVVSMEPVIQNMMAQCGVSEAQLRPEKVIETPIRTLYWDDYQYVAAHPTHWAAPTSLLYGDMDNVVAPADVSSFATRSHADMTIFEGSGHFFQTDAQLRFLRQWLRHKIALMELCCFNQRQDRLHIHMWVQFLNIAGFGYI